MDVFLRVEHGPLVENQPGNGNPSPPALQGTEFCQQLELAWK